MPFGQSLLVRFAVKALANAIGTDSATKEAVSRAAGWAAASLTLDHHSQAVADMLSSTSEELYQAEQEEQVLESAANDILQNKSALADQAYRFSIEKLGIPAPDSFTQEKTIYVLEEFLSLIIYYTISDLSEPDDYFKSYLEMLRSDYINSDNADILRTSISFFKLHLEDKASELNQFPVNLIDDAVHSLQSSVV